MTVQQELQRERASLKARKLAEAIPAMTRPFQRNNVRWTFNTFGTVNRNGQTALRIVATAQQMPSGPLIYDNEEFIFINPPIMVPDGEEANPNNPGQMRPKYKEDLAEAVRLMLAGTIR